MKGPGKYDDLLTRARLEAKAKGAILIVFEGAKGNGFSVQAPAPVLVKLPDLLRTMADDIQAQIPRDLAELGANG